MGNFNTKIQDNEYLVALKLFSVKQTLNKYLPQERSHTPFLFLHAI